MDSVCAVIVMRPSERYEVIIALNQVDSKYTWMSFSSKHITQYIPIEQYLVACCRMVSVCS